ncbi:MAG: Rrf2 family transcriptional regulator [Elusimicrobia bacterium]|nr:Rrf2 family transcriptional regulator [Elusimicrobiota bacterium]
MIYSRTSEYALRALAFMAQKDGGLVTEPREARKWLKGASPETTTDVREVSDATGIPAPYVAKVLQGLARANVLRSKKGRGGGFSFRRHPSKITLWHVVQATDDLATSPLSSCVMGLKQCSEITPCPLHEVWSDTTKRMHEKLQQTTVIDMAGLPGQFARSGSVRRTLSVQMRAIFGHKRGPKRSRRRSQ